ncbi:MAG: hypothetical protein ACPG85_03605 [Flavobacteriales bacterium]
METPDEPEPEAPSNVTVVQLLLEATNTTGISPLNVTFTVTQANATGTNWTMDFGDGTLENGTADDTAWILEHSYEAGNYTAAITLHLDPPITTDINVTVSNVTAPAVSLTDETFAVSGLLVTGVQGLSCGTGNSAADGVTEAWHTWTLPAEEGGVAVSYNKFEAALELGTTSLDIDVDLLDPEGNIIGGSHDFNVLSGAGEAFTIEGDFAPGDYTFYVIACTGVAMEYDLTATATKVAA